MSAKEHLLKEENTICPCPEVTDACSSSCSLPAKEHLLKEENTTMNTHRLPPGTDILFSVAQSVAWELEKKWQQLGVKCEEEALLRRSMALADFRINRYLELENGAKQWPEVQMFLEEAKAACYRSIEFLRRRVSRS